MIYKFQVTTNFLKIDLNFDHQDTIVSINILTSIIKNHKQKKKVNFIS